VKVCSTRHGFRNFSRSNFPRARNELPRTNRTEQDPRAFRKSRRSNVLRPPRKVVLRQKGYAITTPRRLFAHGPVVDPDKSRGNQEKRGISKQPYVMQTVLDLDKGSGPLLGPAQGLGDIVLRLGRHLTFLNHG
jgi:hypothetical protein